MNRLHIVLRYIATTILTVVAGLALAILIVWAGMAWGAAPEQFAVYNACKGVIGDISYSYRASDGAFLIRCPRETEPRIVIKGCRGKLSFDASYNVLVTCPDGRVIPIVRGPYPR